MILKFWLPVIATLLFVIQPSLAEESCECAQSNCGPCEVETGTKFYTSKCGLNDARVKSCKRPKCEAVENQKQCLALFKDQGAAPKAVLASAAEEAPRQIANLATEAGQILDVTGDVAVAHASGITEKPRKREATYVGDVFKTKANGRVKVLLRDGSEMSIAGDSRLKIEKVDVDVVALKRQIALRILSGRVRNKVEKEYKGDNYFQVKTRTAVAGVRGTDFITSYLPKGEEMVSEIRTMKGLVHLEASASAGGPPAQIDVPAGTFAALTTPPLSDSADDDSVRAAAAKAQTSPLYKLKDDELRQLQIEEFLPLKEASAKPIARDIASDDSPVCTEPEGRFNQCSYTCMNNPKGESRCRSDLPDVKCVRRLCRANGRWEETRRLPIDEGGRCAADHAVVGSCESYW